MRGGIPGREQNMQSQGSIKEDTDWLEVLYLIVLHFWSFLPKQLG